MAKVKGTKNISIEVKAVIVDVLSNPNRITTMETLAKILNVSKSTIVSINNGSIEILPKLKTRKLKLKKALIKRIIFLRKEKYSYQRISISIKEAFGIEVSPSSVRRILKNPDKYMEPTNETQVTR